MIQTTTDMLSKDAFAISSRLFDHKAVIKSESKYLVTELELKLNRETFKFVHDAVPRSKQTGSRIVECIDLMEHKMQKVHDLVTSSVTSCHNVLRQKSDNSDEKREKYQKKRDQEWREFVEEMEQARKDVVEKHNLRMEEFDVS